MARPTEKKEKNRRPDWSQGGKRGRREAIKTRAQ